MVNKVNNIISILKWQINSGVFKISEKLPSENALAIKFDCSRLTTRKALQSLKKEGLIISRKAKGYYISAGHNKMNYKTRFGKEAVNNQIHEVEYHLDELKRSVFQDMGFDITKIKKPLEFFKTQMDDNNKPFTVLHSYLNKDVIGNLSINDVKDSISAFLGKRNIKVNRRIERINVIQPPQMVSLKLNLNKNTYVVAAYSIMLNDTGEIIEYAVRYTLMDDYSDTFERRY